MAKSFVDEAYSLFTEESNEEDGHTEVQDVLAFSQGPTNAISGSAMGMASILAGVGLGAGAVVGLPIAGFMANGFTGCASGAAAGVGALPLAAVAGTAAGAVSILNGIVGTPSAVYAFATDDDLHGSRAIDLTKVDESSATEKDDDVVRTRASEAADTTYRPRSKVKDRTLYDTLGVASTATGSDLKKQYYKLARTEHPDKGGDKERFQKITEAYGILSNNETRKKYDEQGMGVLTESEGGGAAAAQALSMMFGECKFDRICGELTASMTFRANNQYAEVTRMSRERDERCAKFLARRLDEWFTDSEGGQGWATKQIKEISELYATNLGPQMCASVGAMYTITAMNHLGTRGRLAQLGFTDPSQAVRTLQTMGKAVTAAVEMQKQAANQHSAEDVNRDKLETSLFALYAIDVESTVRRIAGLALHDTALDKTRRRERAEVLLRLGGLFEQYVKDKEPKLVRIINLRSRPELNGKVATVVALDVQTGRVHVQLDSGETLALKPGCLDGYKPQTSYSPADSPMA